MKKKLKQIICTQMVLVMSILSIGCKNNPTVETGETVSNRETISTEIKNTNVSTENNTVSIGEVKSVRYSGYKDYYYTSVDGKAYLFDTTGKIIKTYAYGEVCPTEFFDGIAIKKW